MTYHQTGFNSYEWTAFTEADLLANGKNGTDFGLGDTFVMSGKATVKMSTTDDDGALNGDNSCRYGDNRSEDRSGQDAFVNGAAVGCKMYAESYHVLRGSDGKTYYLIDIKVEGYSAPGPGDSFYSFYGAKPMAGVQLTVVQTCNVSGSWVDYRCLGAGDLAPPNTPPQFTNVPANGVLCVAENTRLVIDLNATDADGDVLGYKIVGGADAGAFTIDPKTGLLQFTAAPDYERPGSAHGTNAYEVVVAVADGKGGSANKCLTVNVCDVNEPTTPGHCTVIEVENMTLCGYNVRGASSASAGQYAALTCYSGTARTMFKGDAGAYDLTLRHFDQTGAGQIQILVNGSVVRTVNLNADDGKWHDSVVSGLHLKAGDVITLKGAGAGCEAAIMDSIKLCPTTPVDPGTAALGDTVFLDANHNGVQDAGEAGMAGINVTLYDAAGKALGTTVTDANGHYLFDHLKAGTYSVGFHEADGFDFTTRDAGSNDALDSDADQTTGRTGNVTLAVGEVNRTVDAGLVRENAAPVAHDDTGRTCADMPKAVDVLANDTDANGDALAITSVDGKAISEGKTITASDGVLITMTNGTLVFDASHTGYANGLVHTSVTAHYGYTVADGHGGTASADIGMTFCGTVNTLGTIADSLPAHGSMVIDFSTARDGSFFTAAVSGTGDARFDGISFDDVYCVSIKDPITNNVPIKFDMYIADESSLPAGVVPNPQNLDMINWILNQDFNNTDNGDGKGETYTEAEIQGAIWGLTDGNIFVAPHLNYGTTANAKEIYDLAMAHGEGFRPGEGDLVAVILDPADSEAANGNVQPFIVAMPWDSLDYDCVC